MPDWIKKRLQAEQLEKAEEEAKRQRSLAGGLLIEKERPRFWRQLQEKLNIDVQFLPKLGIIGSISAHPGAPSNPSLRINMMRSGIYPNQTYTDVFLDANRIRCTTLGDGAYSFQFCVVSDTEIAVMNEANGQRMDSGQASEYILRRMVELIDRQDMRSTS